MFNNKTILVTGGTGSFGQKFTEYVLNNYSPKKFIIYSRDELKQYEMEKNLVAKNTSCIRYFIGDVRDKERLARAFYGVDYVIHAAALKQVPAAERDPFECIKTNVMGAENIINVSIDTGVKKVVALSTDKAVNPVNLYGASKLCSDKLFVSGNNYSGRSGTVFSVVRYGNVIGSRGSVIPFFQEMRKKGVLPVTDERMTRFWITLEQGVKVVVDTFDNMKGGEIFIPKIPSCTVMAIAKAMAPECKVELIGIRPGEKLHEAMITMDDSRTTYEYKNWYAILPAFHQFHQWTEMNDANAGYDGEIGKKVDDRFTYASDTNKWVLTEEEIQTLIKPFTSEV